MANAAAAAMSCRGATGRFHPSNRNEGHMVNHSTNEFRPGLKLTIDGDPYSILDSEFVKPGKGQAFTRIKISQPENRQSAGEDLQVGGERARG